METIDPRGMAGTIYNRDYQTLLHTKYRSSGACGVREEDFFRDYQAPGHGQRAKSTNGQKMPCTILTPWAWLAQFM